MGWLSLGATIIKEGFDWLKRNQGRKQAADKIKAKWEVVQLERTPWFLSLLAGLHLIAPIDYAFYKAWKAAQPIESPQDVANVIQTTVYAFPVWWTGAVVTLFLAWNGIRANGQEKVRQSRARTKEHEASAVAEREKRNRQREAQGFVALDDRPGPPGGGP